MRSLHKHLPRVAVTLLPLVFMLLHATGIFRLNVLQHVDAIIYDTRLRATMPRTIDERIVIVDIDEKSLAEVGHWPWGRDRLARLTDELFNRQKVALIGFDVLFAEADESSGLRSLEAMAQGPLGEQPGFTAEVQRLRGALDYDAAFARSLQGRPAVLGYYFSSDRDGSGKGVLPAAVMERTDLQGRPIRFTSWNGYGANIAPLAKAAPLAGFFNSITDEDGVVRSVPLIAEYDGHYYESLSLAMFRLLVGLPDVRPGFPRERFLGRGYQGLESVLLQQHGKTLAIPVDDRVAALVPYRGKGGVAGGSFRYISAADLLAGRLSPEVLKDKIVLLGTTAPGLLDLRVTPVGETYPGVETHANVISGLLDGKVFVRPDYAMGYEVIIVLVSGLLLAIALPLLSATRAVALSLAVAAVVIGLNFWLYLGFGLVLPLASFLVMAVTAFALNMSYGYFVESRSKRELALLFGTYVPPELVDEMVKNPDSYSMEAANKELTVMFCDMRGFTNLSEQMEPIALQALLNDLFTRLTNIIRAQRGTIDKYMGDCVMAFWGAPVDLPDHARLAVDTARAMSLAVAELNAEHRAKGVAEIGVGIGLNTGIMCVGDMGSHIRRSYTVVGDAVNLGSRLEGLSKVYGVDVVVSEDTRRAVPDYAWQELDKVRVKGKEKAVSIFWPVSPLAELSAEDAAELKMWNQALKSYRAQQWEQTELQLLNLQRLRPTKTLYLLYSDRVAQRRPLPSDPAWDGSTQFETK